MTIPAFVQVHIVETANGAHINFNDVRGVGDQGNLYRFVGSTEGTENQVAANELTAEENLAFVATGSAPNGRLKALVHLTQNANGDVTATVDNTRVTCQG